MTLTKREKNIAVGLGLTLVLVVLYEFVYSPYDEALTQASQEYRTESDKAVANDLLLNRRTNLVKPWQDLQNAGLTDNESDATALVKSQILDWSRAARFNVSQTQFERTTDALPYEIITFVVNGSGSTPALKRLMDSIETANMPVRLADVNVKSAKEGTDDLSVTMTLLVLCIKPQQDTGDTATASIGGIEDQSWN